MQTWIQPILDFLYKLADKYGTKFIVGLGGIGGVVYLRYFDKLDWASAGAITVIVTGYYFARHVQEINKLGGINSNSINTTPHNTAKRIEWGTDLIKKAGDDE